MCPDSRSHSAPAFGRQQGIGLPIALFVITVLALLVAGMAQLQQGTGQAVSLQVQSQRALHAAESGAQLAVAEVLDAASCTGVPAVQVFSVGALRGCQAALSCAATAPVPLGGSSGNQVFTLVSRGQCGTGNELASRVVEVGVR